MFPLYNPSCLQVMISNNSSNVPVPPGKAITPLAIEAIFFLRECMSSVISIRLRCLWCHPRSTMNRGIIPMVSPPAAMAASFTAPISPIDPAPVINGTPDIAIFLPNDSAASKNIRSTDVLDAQ